MSYISYYRVSTARQGRSGLGLEAQKSIILSHLRGEVPLAEFQDIEHGHDAVRPGLDAALAMAAKTNSILIVAKLDRLSREVGFIDSLMKAKVRFVICDAPEADEFTIHIFAAMAQREYKICSARTRDALAAKKARIKADGGFKDRHGIWRTKLGNDVNLTGRHLGPAAGKAKAAANPNNVKAQAMALLLKRDGCTLQEISSELCRHGFKASQGGDIQPEQVRRLLKRAA